MYFYEQNISKTRKKECKNDKFDLITIREDFQYFGRSSGKLGERPDKENHLVIISLSSAPTEVESLGYNKLG